MIVVLFHGLIFEKGHKGTIKSGHYSSAFQKNTKRIATGEGDDEGVSFTWFLSAPTISRAHLVAFLRHRRLILAHSDLHACLPDLMNTANYTFALSRFRPARTTCVLGKHRFADSC